MLVHEALRSLLAQQGGSILNSPIMVLPLLVGIFYLMLWRPQQKQAQEHREMVGGLKKGDEVITNGGLVGKVHAVTDKFVMVEIARDVKVRILKTSVTGKVPEGSAAETAEAKPESKDK